MKKRGWIDLLLPIGVIVCLLVIFVPLPPSLMDVLLAANISLAVIILLTTLYVRTPIEFSVFPSLLLVTTMMRISLNIATTRLILAGGASDGEMAAGSVIQSFGAFVAGDQIAIGLVIFSIIVIVQFVVITKGATRISEVAARFALDGLPGRQMSIDADLNAGLIDSETARLKREEISIHTDFYGAMDGASKFVRGDAIAGILITMVNIVGGLVVGLMAGMSIVEASSVFTKLTIGDGLVSQLPALLISIAAGMLMTRSTRSTNLPRESINQVFAKPAVLIITSVFLAAMAFTELPKIPLLLLAAACLFGAWIIRNREQKSSSHASNLENSGPKTSDVTIERLLGNDILEMELGLDLIRLADPKLGGQLLPAVTDIRKKLASQLGVVLPKIRIRDNLKLNSNEYRILVHGNPVDIGTIFPDYLMAVDKGQASAPVVGAVATETTENGQAFWIRAESRPETEANGYEVVDSTTALSQRMSDLAFMYAPEMLTRDATKQLIDETRKSSPAIIEELVPEILTLKQMQQLLKRLVAEGISIRPMGLILETLSDRAVDGQKTIWKLVEAIRQRLAPQITARVLGQDHIVRAFSIESELQNRISDSWESVDDEVQLQMPHDLMLALGNALRQGAENLKHQGLRPVVIVDQEIRPVIGKLVRDQNMGLFVVGSKEIVGATIEMLGEITADQLQPESAAA